MNDACNHLLHAKVQFIISRRTCTDIRNSWIKAFARETGHASERAHARSRACQFRLELRLSNTCVAIQRSQSTSLSYQHSFFGIVVYTITEKLEVVKQHVMDFTSVGPSVLEHRRQHNQRAVCRSGRSLLSAGYSGVAP
ncbi:hypothetical protein CEXT_315451 [Caerostris extrusa]|uniref:Uncharacterized protein n=1 Tax=Caerostris extrusa TaxID=172846 RepID=A0AAV4QES6_CAEEX|nr:hypothetical protein CEXT_315451 [Caerostris extrusa]